ncbi:MAG: Fis family transcriptional regulator [Desulfobacterales bacterium CG23_combo_of_CG06-09_8_20_14_all_51_8]|nr:MAG: Fis family transcriptional regulator [Desulfobacterales bacterium CG23_combo_of_CG06-09_8_20_14_all_51_8]
MKMRLAIIDDEITVCTQLTRTLAAENFEVESFQTGAPFLVRMAQYPFDIIFIDLKLPDMDGIEILSRIKTAHDDAEAIIITGHGTIESAVQAIKQGAYHFITKPFRLPEVRSLAAGARDKILLRRENKSLRKALSGSDFMSGFIGASPPMQDVFDLIRKVAAVDCNILLQAETGTGKEMAARAIHHESPRKNFPFVSFNCGGFAEELICSELFGYEKGAFTGAAATKIGLLESANGGSVFLDEIGEMPLAMQVKLLHVIQEKRILRVGGVQPIDLQVRIIAATNKDLKKAVERGEFREDLFYRLNVVAINLPKLSERRDDIPLLTAHFIEKFNTAFSKKTKRISSQAMGILMNYNFPGNVRELENIIQRAVALAEGEVIGVSDLPSDLQKLEFSILEGEGLLSLEDTEKQHIEKVLNITAYNTSLASSILNIPRTTLWRRMKRFGLVKKPEDKLGS